MIVMGNTPQPDAALKILTPWWDVLTRYLTGGLMTIALTTTALQAAKDNLVCSPVVNCSLKPSFLNSSASHKSLCSKVDFRLNNQSDTVVVTTMADFRQYNFLDALCFHEGVEQWYPVYFPFILVAEALLLLLIDNFWIMYPKTSSALNHFVTLAMECYSSVGTNLNLFQELSSTSPEDYEPPLQTLPEEVDVKRGAESVLLKSVQPTPSKDSEPSTSNTGQPNEPSSGFNISLSDATKVKTLYQRVEELSEKYGHKHNLLTKVYRARAVFQFLICLFILVFHLVNLNLINEVMECKLPKKVFVTSYERFLCARFIAPYYRAVTLIFVAATLVYLVPIIYIFYWSKYNTSRINIFSEVAIVDDKVHKRSIKGDLAFLYSLLEQYNKLYCDRLAVFLSKGMKDKLDSKIAALRKVSLKGKK